jgi:hypothetical protein
MREKFLITVILFLTLIAVAISISEGAPNPLPGITLGSVAVLHVLRWLVLFGAAVGGLVVFRQALRGQLPIEIGTRGLRYRDESETTRHTEQGLKVFLDDQIDYTREMNKLAQSIHELEQRMSNIEMSTTITEVENDRQT